MTTGVMVAGSNMAEIVSCFLSLVVALFSLFLVLFIEIVGDKKKEASKFQVKHKQKIGGTNSSRILENQVTCTKVLLVPRFTQISEAVVVGLSRLVCLVEQKFRFLSHNLQSKCTLDNGCLSTLRIALRYM